MKTIKRVEENMEGKYYIDLDGDIILVTGGFGCDPRSTGRAIFYELVATGNSGRHDPEDIDRLATKEEIKIAKAKFKDLQHAKKVLLYHASNIKDEDVRIFFESAVNNFLPWEWGDIPERFKDKKI